MAQFLCATSTLWCSHMPAPDFYPLPNWPLRRGDPLATELYKHPSFSAPCVRAALGASPLSHPDNTVDHSVKHKKSLIAAPTLFDLLKWKCQEFQTDQLKSCTVVSYKNHPRQSY